MTTAPKRRFLRRFQNGQRVEVCVGGAWCGAIYGQSLRTRKKVEHVVLLDRAHLAVDDGGFKYLTRRASVANSAIRCPKETPG